jgi:hypothetical protein
MPSLLRVSGVAVGLVAVVLTILWRVSHDESQRARDEIAALRTQMEEALEAREAMIERLSRSRRVAHLKIQEQWIDAESQLTTTEVLFVELDDDGAELGRQTFTLPGDVLMVDAWTVKFDPSHVADGHPLTGQTLILLRRVFTDLMRPVDGVTIDTPGAVPPGYAAGEIGRFEQQLWEHFWDIAAEPETARSMGVRVAQGEIVYKPVRAGQLFELQVDAVGGMNLAPLPVEPTSAEEDAGEPAGST